MTAPMKAEKEFRAQFCRPVTQVTAEDANNQKIAPFPFKFDLALPDNHKIPHYRLDENLQLWEQ